MIAEYLNSRTDYSIILQSSFFVFLLYLFNVPALLIYVLLFLFIFVGTFIGNSVRLFSIFCIFSILLYINFHKTLGYNALG
jgi:hypothetical protein